jgi:thiopeptide-type bacteriocin biosynthesis protein
MIDRWFFIRYADPDPHLRWRLHAAPFARPSAIRRAVENAIKPLVASGRVSRAGFDTYQREIERYGGPEGIEASEELFCADSDAVIDILDALADSGDAAADLRWRLAIAGTDRLLADFDLGLETRMGLMQEQRAAFGCESHVTPAFAGNWRRSTGRSDRSSRVFSKTRRILAARSQTASRPMRGDRCESGRWQGGSWSRTRVRA